MKTTTLKRTTYFDFLEGQEMRMVGEHSNGFAIQLYGLLVLFILNEFYQLLW